MSITIRTLLALCCAMVGTASADSLVYNVVQSESNTSATAGLVFFVDATPDFTELLGTDEFPTQVQAVGSSNTLPQSSSKLTADVGLPGNFNNGANGITISQWNLNVPEAPGPIQTVGFTTVPLNATGSEVQLFALQASMSSFSITLDSPLSSTLTPTGNPNEWLWAGTADVTVSGAFSPEVVIPTVQTIALDPVPFSQATTVALTGTFSGDGTGTQVTVGIPTGGLPDLNIEPDPVNEQFDLELLGIPVVTIDLFLDSFSLTDVSGQAVYRNNALPIPEPSTVVLFGLGIAGLALRRNR